MLADMTFKTASQLLDHMLDLAYFHPEGDEPAAIPCHRVAGRDPLVVMVGDNASGKSFARRIINAITNGNTQNTFPQLQQAQAHSGLRGGRHIMA